MSLAEALIADYTAEAEKTIAVLRAVPEDRYDWKPHEKSMSLGQLASHIAEAPTWHDAMLQDVFDFASEMADYKPYSAPDQAQLLATFAANSAGLTRALEGKDDAFMTGTWKGMSGDKQLMGGPREKVMREILLHHMIHHRGQLTVYLRLLDVPLPPTFGPTADSSDWS